MRGRADGKRKIKLTCSARRSRECTSRSRGNSRESSVRTARDDLKDGDRSRSSFRYDGTSARSNDAIVEKIADSAMIS